MVPEVISITKYCSRWAFIINRCRDQAVLHLGCIGETDVSVEDKLDSFNKKRVLHPYIADVAKKIVGVDLDVAAVERLRSVLGLTDVLVGDVERLNDLSIPGPFDVVLCGDLLEHLSCPGLALDGIRSLLADAGELVISVPNSFGLLANLRFTMGRFRDGAQHVAAYSKFTLTNLLERHGFEITELYTSYNRPPLTKKQVLKYAFGILVLRLMPERGGTLLAIAKKKC